MHFLMRKHPKRCSLVRNQTYHIFKYLDVLCRFKFQKKREPIWNLSARGTFVGYSDTSKEFRIYVPSEKHVEVSQDVTFHEDTSFKQSKELECDLETEEDDAPISEDHDDDSSPSDVQRENLAEHAQIPAIDEPVELVDEPPAKRRSAWC